MNGTQTKRMLADTQDTIVENTLEKSSSSIAMVSNNLPDELVPEIEDLNEHINIQLDSKLGTVHQNYLLANPKRTRTCRKPTGCNGDKACACGKKQDDKTSKAATRPRYFRERSNPVLNPLMNSLITSDQIEIESEQFELRADKPESAIL